MPRLPRKSWARTSAVDSLGARGETELRWSPGPCHRVPEQGSFATTFASSAPAYAEAATIGAQAASRRTRAPPPRREAVPRGRAGDLPPRRTLKCNLHGYGARPDRGVRRGPCAKRGAGPHGASGCRDEGMVRPPRVAFNTTRPADAIAAIEDAAAALGARAWLDVAARDRLGAARGRVRVRDDLVLLSRRRIISE